MPRHRWWRPASLSRGPGTSPRRTGSCTAGGARPRACAGAAAHGIPTDTAPAPPTGDLFEFASEAAPLAADALVDGAGHLRGDHESWLRDPAHLEAWARAALETAHRQHDAAAATSVRLPSTVYSESAAALLCLELQRDGLPIDRETTEALIAGAAGPRPTTDADEAASRRVRDAQVLRLAPGRESTDLRNPAQVRELLAAVGVEVPNTRKWVLEDQRAVHPVVGALLDWRKRERIATTYGHRWLAEHVGADDRLRGSWTACDGAGGRMTADNGLHNLPAALRPGVAAHLGQVSRPR
jgi:DNA polymerase-1